MKLTEIENLSFEDLKRRRDELVKAAKGEPAAELAARYVQARTDAKGRDEKLAEQATTIDALTNGNGALMQQKASLEKLVNDGADACERLRGELDRLAHEAKAKAEADAKVIANLMHRLNEQVARAERLKSTALRNHSAASSAAKTLNDALAAHAVDAADAGE